MEKQAISSQEPVLPRNANNNSNEGNKKTKPKPAPIPILSLKDASPGTSPTVPGDPGKEEEEISNNNNDYNLNPDQLSPLPTSTDVSEALLDPNMTTTPNNGSPDSRNKRATWYGGEDVSLNFPNNASPLRPPSPIKGVYNPPRASSPVRTPPASSIPPRSMSPVKGGENNNGSPNNSNNGPFNFESTIVTPGSGGGAPSKRRGHKYKHSSVSINFFQEPPKRAPLAIPASLPIPTIRECYQSMSREQTVRLSWCLVHLIAAYMVYNTHQSLMALSALAHLLFYDAMGATLCCLVDVLGNFSVWHQSSILYPFGLERIEVLAGFALSVTLIFMGGDIMSHSIQTIVQTLYAPPGGEDEAGGGQHHHGNHHAHDATTGSVSSMVMCVLFGIVVTIISAVGLENHSRISKTMRHHINLLSLQDIPANPSHFLTISFSLAVIMIPTVLSSHAVIVDTILTPLMAFGMCYVGWALAKVLSGMLVMSHSGPDMTLDIQNELKSDAAVDEVWDISFWQVHHQLWLASMKVSMTGTESDEGRVRKSAEDAIRNIMEGDYAAVKWESTIDVINLSQR